MEFVKHDPSVAVGATGVTRPEVIDYRGGEVLQSAFRQENDLVNLAQINMRPTFQPNPEFDIVEALRDNPLREEYAEVLGRAQSQEELDYLIGDVQQELQDKQILASAGFGGFVASAVAGMVSPVSLVPLAGPARGLRGARNSFALAGASVTAQEAALYGMQRTRTPEEVTMGITMGTVLGGLLGTAARELSPRARVALEQDMAGKRGSMTISHADPETGTTIRSNFDSITSTSIKRPSVPFAASDTAAKVRAAEATPVAKASDIEGQYTQLAATLRDLPLQTIRGFTIGVPKARGGITPEQALAIALDAKGPLRNGVEETQLGAIKTTQQYNRIDNPYLLVSRRGGTASDTASKNVVVQGPAEVALPELRRAYPDVNFMTTKEAVEWMGEGGPLRQLDEVETQIKFNDIEVSSRSLSAAEVDAPARGLAKPGPVSGKLIELLSRLNPVTRLFENPISPHAKVWMEKIFMPGVKLEGNAAIDPASGGGTAYARAQVHQAKVADFIRAYDDAYARHYHGGNLPEGKLQSAWLETLKSGAGRVPEGKLSYRDFGVEAFRVANTGQRHADPFVNKAAEAQHTYYKYVDDLAQRYFDERKFIEGDEAVPLYSRQEFGEDSDIQNYVHHMFDEVAVTDNMAEFLDVFAKNGEEILNARFAKAHQTHLESLAKIEAEEELYRLPTKDLTARINTATKNMEEFETKYAPQLEGIETFRKQLKDAGVEGRELRDQMTSYRNNLGQEFVEARRMNAAWGKELKMLEKAKKMPPKRRVIEADAIAKRGKELDDKFFAKWRDEGGSEIDTKAGTADFSFQAREDAKHLFQNITGQRNRVAGLDVLGGNRGPQLQRTLNLPFEQKMKFLVTDPEKVVRSHAHTMFPDLELYRISGTSNGARIFADIEDDIKLMMDNIATATHIVDGKPLRLENVTPTVEPGVKGAAKDVANRAKETVQFYRNLLTGEEVKPTKRIKELNDKSRQDMLRNFQKQVREVQDDMRGVIDQMRHHRGVPKNGDSFGYRLGRAARNANVFRFMGMVSVSSLPDLARPVMRYGLTKTFNNAWKPLVSDLQRVKTSRAEAYRAGIALDPIMHNRSAAVFDVGENHSLRQNMIERGLEFLANKTGFVGLFDRWTAENKHLATNLVYGEMSHAIRQVAEGVDDVKARELLHQAGISDNMARRIWAQYLKEGGSTEFNDGVRLPNTEAWDDFDAVMAQRAAVNQISEDLIVTPALDRPLWMTENEAFRVVAQFRSFTFTATNRIIMSGLQEQDMAFMQGTIMSLALGAISYYTWAAASGGSQWEKAKNADMDIIVYEAMQRSGIMGVLSEGQRIGEQIPGLNDYFIFGGEGRSTRRAESILGAVLGPSYDLGERLATVAQGLSEPTQSTLHTARGALVPYQNVFYFRQLLDAMESGLADLVGIPETRR